MELIIGLGEGYAIINLSFLLALIGKKLWQGKHRMLKRSFQQSLGSFNLPLLIKCYQTTKKDYQKKKKEYSRDLI